MYGVGWRIAPNLVSQTSPTAHYPALVGRFHTTQPKLQGFFKMKFLSPDVAPTNETNQAKTIPSIYLQFLIYEVIKA